MVGEPVWQAAAETVLSMCVTLCAVVALLLMCCGAVVRTVLPMCVTLCVTAVHLGGEGGGILM